MLLDELPPDIVIIHDGCRMFVEDRDLNTIATEAFKYGVGAHGLKFTCL